MKQNLILVVILLATLLTVNAIPHQLRKRETTFSACSAEIGSPNVLTVSVTPDPPVAGQDADFTIEADFPVDTPDQLVIVSIDNPNSFQTETPIDICSSPDVTCPTSTLSMTETLPINATSTGSFIIEFAIVDATKTALGCAIATITF